MSAGEPRLTQGTAHGGTPRNLALDLLRAVAIFLVIGRHMAKAPADWSAAARWPWDLWRQAGWIGVDLFFVLSGFLVSGLLFKEHQQRGSISVGRFYLRRGLKIYPSFYFFLLAGLVIRNQLHDPYTWKNVLSEVLFVQSYYPGMWPHTWSLAVEEHFYILTPLLLLVLYRFNRHRADPFRWLPVVFAVLAAALLLLRIRNVGYYARWSMHTHLFPTHLRIDALFFGVLLSYFYHYHGASLAALLRPRRHWLLLAGVLLLTPAAIWRLEHPIISTVGYTLLYLGSGAILMAMLYSDIPRNRLTRAAAYIGSHSYSIYLWHVAVIEWAVPSLFRLVDFNPPYLLYVLLVVVGSCAVGIVIANAVEYPVLRLRDRWFPSRSSSPIAAAPGLDQGAVVTAPRAEEK